MSRATRTLVISDTHCPFHHPDAWDWLADIRRQHRPTRIVHIGDEIDAHSLSRYVANPDLPSPGEELHRAKESLSSLHKLFPVVHVCESNHTVRPLKRAAEAKLPSAFLRTLADVLGLRRWRWAPRWEFDGVVYQHGDGFAGQRAALTAAERNRKSTVIGHVHTEAGVAWSASYHDQIFGLGVGCLIDPSHAAFDYAKHFARRPILGCGIVADDVPTFLPMI